MIILWLLLLYNYYYYCASIYDYTWRLLLCTRMIIIILWLLLEYCVCNVTCFNFELPKGRGIVVS